MSNTIIYSIYNPIPGSDDTYDYGSGEETPIFPDVTLYNSFNYTLKGIGINSRDTPTAVDDDNDNGISESVATPPVRNGVSRGPRYGYSGLAVAKIPTEMRWVTNLGPDGNGAAQNEKGDWISLEALEQSDRFGPGIRLETIPRTGTETLYYQQEDDDEIETIEYTANKWNYLKISGAYNASAFPYNKFAYTDDYPSKDNGYTTGGGEVDSLFELPGKFNALHKFIPDQRDQTTLTFTVEIDWERRILTEPIYDNLTPQERQQFLDDAEARGIGVTGTDRHTVDHVVFNDTSNWRALLEETLEKQYTTEEQWKNGGQDFPFRTFNFTLPEEQSGTETTPFLDQIKDIDARVVAVGVSGESDITITTTTSGKPKIGDFVFGEGIGENAVVMKISRKEKDIAEFYGTTDATGSFTATADTGDFFVSNTEKYKLLEISSLIVNPADGGTNLNLPVFAFTVSPDRTTVTVNAGSTHANKTVKLRGKVFAKVPQTNINLSVPNTGIVNGQVLFKRGE